MTIHWLKYQTERHERLHPNCMMIHTHWRNKISRLNKTPTQVYVVYLLIKKTWLWPTPMHICRVLKNTKGTCVMHIRIRRKYDPFVTLYAQFSCIRCDAMHLFVCLFTLFHSQFIVSSTSSLENHTQMCRFQISSRVYWLYIFISMFEWCTCALQTHFSFLWI